MPSAKVSAKTAVPASGPAMLSRRWHTQKGGAEQGNGKKEEGSHRPNQEGFQSTHSLPPWGNVAPFYAAGTGAREQLRHPPAKETSSAFLRPAVVLRPSALIENWQIRWPRRRITDAVP